MRHKALLLFLVSLSRFSMATENTSDFVFNESHFRDLNGILNTTIAPKGRVMESRPVPIAFAPQRKPKRELLETSCAMSRSVA